MKQPKSLASLVASCFLLQFAIASCSSDPNPVNYINVKGEKSFVSLDLSVAATRASDPNATSDETKVSSVSVYIFDGEDRLEKIYPGLAVSGGKIAKIETTSGLKTIYAVAAGSVSGVTEGTTNIEQFENQLLPSTIDRLKSESGFVMTGKSEKKLVMKSSSEESMPSSNSFAITLQRLAAKVKVVGGEDFGKSDSNIGFFVEQQFFSVCQTANTMRLTPNDTDLAEFKDGNSDGTYDNYSISDSQGYISFGDSFTAQDCRYVSENIVGTPVSGNTTFVCVRLDMAPSNLYSFTEGETAPAKNNVQRYDVNSYYVVGIADRSAGFIDYTVDTDKKVICFDQLDDANRYCSALNENKVQAVTVSESGEVMRMPASTRAEALEYEVFTFENRYAYYRVNIGNTSGGSKQYRVDRNTYYKITINSVKTLGFPSESMLRPTNPDASLELSPSTWLDASFDVENWVEVDQPVDL